MAANVIDPAQPPLPTAWNLPFQSVAGSQASVSICESGEGVRTMATRQYAGSIRAGAAPRPPGAGAALPRPGGCGGRNGPAGTDSTVVKVTLGSVSDLRFSQGVWAKALNSAPEKANARKVRVIMEGPQPMRSEIKC